MHHEACMLREALFCTICVLLVIVYDLVSRWKAAYHAVNNNHLPPSGGKRRGICTQYFHKEDNIVPRAYQATEASFLVLYYTQRGEFYLA